MPPYVDEGKRGKNPEHNLSHLEVQVVLALLVELGRSDIQTDLDLTLVTCELDSFGEELKRFFSSRDVRSETTLVTDVGSCEEFLKPHR